MRKAILVISILVALAGSAGLLAALAAYVRLDDDSSARPLVRFVVQAALVCIIASAGAIYASRTRRGLPGDTTAVTAVVRVVIAVGLVAAPVWMLLRLGNFVADWSRARALGAGSRMWEDAASSVGGVALIPIAAVLTPPAVLVLTMAAFIVASATLLVWLLRRREALPRWYLAWIFLLAGLNFASASAAAATSDAAAIVARAVAQSERPGEDLAPITAWVELYTADVNASATVLAWTLTWYALLLVLVYWWEWRRSNA